MNKISEKIQKLLSLATSSNENEAKLAANKASELMVKYNLRLQDLKEKLEYNKDVLDVQVRAKIEDKFIIPILTEYFFVKIVSSKENFGKTYYILGEEENVKIANYVYLFLKRTFRDLWKSYKKETKSPKGYQQSYYYGLYSGLKTQLEATKVKVQEETKAVVVTDANLNKFMKSAFPRIRSKSTKVNHRDARAEYRGLSDGQNIRINKGVESKATNNNLFLGQ
jgi:hypothetical protein